MAVEALCCARPARIPVLKCKVTQTESALFSAPFALGWSIAPHERVQPCGERWVSDRFWPVSVLSLRDASQPNVNVRRSRQRKIRAVQVLRPENRGAMPGAQNCRLYSTSSCLKSYSDRARHRSHLELQRRFSLAASVAKEWGGVQPSPSRPLRSTTYFLPDRHSAVAAAAYPPEAVAIATRYRFTASVPAPWTRLPPRCRSPAPGRRP